MKPLLSYINSRNIASLILVLFCIQYIPIESRDGVSYLKLVVSAICPLIILFYTPKISKITFLFLLYYLILILVALRNSQSLRWSTILFHGTFIITYITFYQLVVLENAFTRDFYIKLLQRLIMAFFVLLVIQQFFIIIGIKIFPLINLVQYLDRGIGANSLSYEPSSTAMVLSYAYLSLIRMYELNYGRKLKFFEIIKESKWVTIGFLWCMISIVSGTAFFALIILSFYFFRYKHVVTTFVLIAVILISINFIEFTPIERAKDSFLAFLTLNNENVAEADGSAAARIIPILNTINNFDLFSVDFWLGHGVDYGLSKGIFSDRIMIGNISDYGFLCFILVQIIVYKSMIKNIISLETLFWIILGFATLANTPTKWGIMMMFTVVRYFQTIKENGCISDHSEL